MMDADCYEMANHISKYEMELKVIVVIGSYWVVGNILLTHAKNERHIPFT
jgi:hypothetical protein